MLSFLSFVSYFKEAVNISNPYMQRKLLLSKLPKTLERVVTSLGNLRHSIMPLREPPFIKLQAPNAQFAPPKMISPIPKHR